MDEENNSINNKNNAVIESNSLNLVEKNKVFKNFNINLAQRFIFNRSNKYGLEQILEEQLKLFYILNQEARL